MTILMTKQPKIRPEYLEGLRNYAAADRSDPFTYSRGLAHLRSGAAGFRQGKGLYHNAGEPAFYSAQPADEERTTAGGEDYTVTVYRNIQRP